MSKNDNLRLYTCRTLDDQLAGNSFKLGRVIQHVILSGFVLGSQIFRFFKFGIER